MEAMADHPELLAEPSVAAHLIHGSSEGRFEVIYCPGGHMPLERVRGVGFDAMPHAEAVQRYGADTLKPGFNEVDGEEVFFVPNPALGLWAAKSRLGG